MASEEPHQSTDGTSLRSDEPIRTADQDQLARGHLVEVIGRHILHANAPESVVIALNAPWGGGKSSFLNLLGEKLVPPLPDEAPDDARPILIPFNPWHYTNVEQLVRMFSVSLREGSERRARRSWARRSGGCCCEAQEVSSVSFMKVWEAC